MGEREKNQNGKDAVSRRHPIRQQLVAVFLGICMIVVSIPVSSFGLNVQAAENLREILSFSELPDEVREQTVRQGRIKQEPEFPTVLKVQCRVVKEEGAAAQPESTESMEGTTEEITTAGEKSLQADPAAVFSEEGTAEDGTAASSLNDMETEDETTTESAVEAVESEPSEEPGTQTDVEEAATEEVAIEGVTWNSEIEYDGWTEGVYVFMPILPEGYVLAQGAELPKITVTVEGNKDGISERTPETEPEEPGQKRLLQNRTKLFVERVEPEELAVERQLPGCGTISEDTVWSGNVTLADGELIVEPGVTLTIQGVVTVQGNVTIKGGGTIKRGSGNAYFSVYNGAHLTVGNVTLDGASLPSDRPMVEVVKSEATLDDGCRIMNCIKASGGPWVDYVNGNGQKTNASGGGPAFYLAGGKAIFNDIIIENNCSNIAYGGAVWICNSELTINSGTYRNNKAVGGSGSWGGGCFYNVGAKLYIYGGNFIGNSTTARGGCILNLNDSGTETYLYGGCFEGNKCSASGYQGSGAVFHCAYDQGRPTINGQGALLDISGNVQFVGDGTEGSGTDGVYLDLSPSGDVARKITISDTLRYPVTLYLKASEGYVIAEGTNEYRLLHERDMKKIHFVDVGNSGKTWYAVLDKEKNQVYLSETNPNYGYYVYYLNNGAQGTVVDDNKYQIDDSATVQPADGLQREGYQFVEWNTKADGSGTPYQPGEDLTIEGDTDLYAIFVKGKVLKADFYSGSAGQKQTKSVELAEGAEGGSVTAPELEEMEGWSALGWSEDAAAYDELIEPGEEIFLTEDQEYYGVYEKDVTLTYEAEHADIAPQDDVAKCHAIVYEEVATTPARFEVAPAAVRYGYAFAGWNAEEDLTGRTYRQGEILETDEDATLYAIFKRPLHAYFHSGSAGQVEEQVVEIPEDATSGTVRTLELKDSQDMAAGNWQPVGWDLQEDGYGGEIKAGEEVILTDDTDYYGIYKKEVTLSYDANGGESCPRGETKECCANVHEEVSYDEPTFKIAAELEREGYTFTGWNTEKDGTGEPFEAGKDYELTGDTRLYAQWEAATVTYQVEHYKQDLEGDGYTRVDDDTECIAARAGEEVEAKANDYIGFTENKEHALRCASGIVKADNSLVLKLYYDRDVYHVNFDLNGGTGNVPNSQDVRYEGVLQSVAAPKRAGYNFKGWYLDSSGSEGKQWDFARTVEVNASSRNVTLYAKWADEIAPVLGRTTYGKGHKDLFGWILHKNRLKVTVPVTEEGSGVKQAEYILMPEGAEERETAYIGTPGMVYGTIGLPLGAVNAGGNRSTKGRARVTTRNGKIVAEFTISEDFKGTVAMTANDWAGNISAEKLLTADGNGVIVEDNAPDIRFIPDSRGQYDNVSVVGVEVRDNAGENISGGIANVTCRVDSGKEVSVPEERFQRGIVEFSKFTVKVSGSGTHILRVEAVDNAGNKSSRKFNVDIRGKESAPPTPGTGTEPKTGDSTHVEVCATVSMIAGFSYLLLYFRERGMTEEKKEELVSRLVRWAKGKSGIRKMAALALIFLLLTYYHSIGKTIDGKWEGACQQ